MLYNEIGGRVLAVRPESGQGCHYHSVLEGDGADLDGLKELGCGHCEASEGCYSRIESLFYTAVHRGGMMDYQKGKRGPTR